LRHLAGGIQIPLLK